MKKNIEITFLKMIWAQIHTSTNTVCMSSQITIWHHICLDVMEGAASLNALVTQGAQ